MKIELDIRKAMKKTLKTMEKANEFKQAIKNAGLDVQKEAKKNVPVDTGALKTSIGLEVDETNNTIVSEVSVGKGYGKYVEYGTGEKGMATNKQEGISYTKGFPGQNAQPFFNPAVDVAKKQLHKKIKKIIRK